MKEIYGARACDLWISGLAHDGRNREATQTPLRLTATVQFRPKG